MSTIGEIETLRTARGLKRYEIEVSHAELHKYQVIRGDAGFIVKQRADALAAQWDAMWMRRSGVLERRQEREAAARDIEAKKRLATERTEEARRAIEELQNILAHTLDIDDTIEWDLLKDTSSYSVPKPPPPVPTPPPASPSPIREPRADDPDFRPQYGFLDAFSASRRAARDEAAREAFKQARAGWKADSERQTEEFQSKQSAHRAELRKQEQSHKAALCEWEHGKRQFEEEQSNRNAAIDLRRERYVARDPEAITEYCSMVLENSSYPDYLPQSFQLEYNAATGILVVDYRLPAPADIPAVIEVKYVKTTDAFVERQMAEAQSTQLYDSVLYQVVLRTIHEELEADSVSAVNAIVVNGWVHSIDAATGQEIDSCVLSVQAGREEFRLLNLRGVDPRACFRRLKGVGSARLHSLAAVAPLLTISREDKRFVSSRAVVDVLAEGENLASIDWQDFEHLIRELFEEEFSTVGGEVKVTRASRDGGVDAVVFDPDPLRGGKTVIQAKRYTNPVGVSAVRDLYGTVLNEGANKGILVTTSDYGPDAYEFAKGKPLVLLNGGNLLHMLERHGHRARIDLQEAKKIMSEREMQ